MLTCKHLHVALLQGRVLIDDLSFSLNAGDHIGVIAEEGNGKSTLLKILAGEKPDYVSITGLFHITGKPAVLEQQIDPCWLLSTPLDYLLKEKPDEEVPLENWNLLPVLEKSAATNGISKELLYTDHLLQDCSGGEKVRLQFLKMMEKDPDYYLLDEPTNDLDLQALQWIEDWIKKCPKPVLFVSHDITLLKSCADGILHLEARNKKSKPVSTFFGGGYEEYQQTRQACRQKQQQVAQSEKRDYEKQKQRLNDLHNKVEGKLRTVSRQAPQVGKNLKDKMRSVKSSQAILERTERTKTDSAEEEIHFFFPDSSLPSAKVILDLSNMKIELPGRVLLSAFDLKIMGKDRIILSGPNGSGKTMLMKMLAGLLLSRKDLNAGYMPQDYDSQFSSDQTPISFLQKVCTEDDTIRRQLGSLHFTFEEMNQSASLLSGGQKAKLYLAMLALQHCNVLLLDEPTRNLSPLSIPVLFEALNNFEGCILAITHDRALMEQNFNRFLTIENGCIKEKR